MSNVTLADVESILNDMGIHYHAVNECQCDFIARVDGERFTFSGFHVRILSERNTLSVCFRPLGFQVKQSALIHTLKLCHLINNELCTGYFNITDDGAVGYTYTQFISKDILTRHLMEDIFEISTFSWETFADSIVPIMLGFSEKPVDAFEYCINKYYKDKLQDGDDEQEQYDDSEED